MGTANAATQRKMSIVASSASSATVGGQGSKQQMLPSKPSGSASTQKDTSVSRPVRLTTKVHHLIGSTCTAHNSAEISFIILKTKAAYLSCTQAPVSSFLASEDILWPRVDQLLLLFSPLNCSFLALGKEKRLRKSRNIVRSSSQECNNQLRTAHHQHHFSKKQVVLSKPKTLPTPSGTCLGKMEPSKTKG
jgi:hypothetical protein